MQNRGSTPFFNGKQYYSKEGDRKQGSQEVLEQEIFTAKQQIHKLFKCYGVFDIGSKTTEWIALFSNELAEEENEAKENLEEMLSRSTRVAFHSEVEKFEEYLDLFKDSRLLRKVRRAKESGKKFDGKLKEKKGK